MPCRTDDSYNQQLGSLVPIADYEKLKREADTVTRLLCSIMKLLEKNDGSASVSELSSIDGLTNWWRNHKESDRRRIEKEVESAVASLGDLSEEAKQLLIKRLEGSN